MTATEQKLQEMLAPQGRKKRDEHDFLQNVPKVRCADGFKMSVQASTYHYCTPRDSVGPWSAVEVGFPSHRVEAFMPYIDGDEDTDPTDTVYGYVPIGIVAQAIDDHGGFAVSETAVEAQP